MDHPPGADIPREVTAVAVRMLGALGAVGEVGVVRVLKEKLVIGEGGCLCGDGSDWKIFSHHKTFHGSLLFEPVPPPPPSMESRF